MNEFYDDRASVDITFNSIGSFLKSGALFYSPTITKDLIEFHSNHHKYFKQFNDIPISIYSPDNWIPHCTLSNRLSSERLAEAFNYCLSRNETVYGKIKEVAIIKIVNKNTVPIIFSKKLKEN
ncbi:2'-5' RNA ligase family protein [Neobacillus sp. PS3-34]|uniref:2'-5' RNA ligase family protein n=1 Tax=Neobacillus sp. PS3-34 TaxID=3070678 RepID=UPI0035A5ACF2